MPPDIPHFDLPFRFQGAVPVAAQVEQDTVPEIEVCIEACIRTRPGDRMTNPAFGIPDPTFTVEGDDTVDNMVQIIERWEPRASILVQEAWDFEAFVRQLKVRIREEGNLG